MSDEHSIPTPEAVLAHLRETGTGAIKVKMVADWLARPVHWDETAKDWKPVEATAENLLLWAEDVHAEDVQQLGEGTLTKIGVQVRGKTYGIRRRQETNSDEVARLNAKVNELEHKLKLANNINSLTSGKATEEATTRRRLEEEVSVLRLQNDALRRQLGPVDVEPVSNRRSRRKAAKVGGTTETSGQLVAAE